jgi:hypothetical protein
MEHQLRRERLRLDAPPLLAALPFRSSSATAACRRRLRSTSRGELDRRAAAKLLTHDEARRIAANIGKLPQKHTGLYRTSAMTSTSDFRRTALTDVMGHELTHALQQSTSSLDHLVGACH